MGCAALVLAPLLLVIAALTVARPLLESRWETWRAERPWVDQLVGLAAGAREMLGSTNAEAGDTASRRSSARGRLAGVNDRHAMPADLPLWPAPDAETFSAGGEHAAAYQRVLAGPDSVVRWFRRTMPAKGWTLHKERPGAGGRLLLYRKGDRIARVEVVTDATVTEIWLRSRRVERSP